MAIRQPPTDYFETPNSTSHAVVEIQFDWILSKLNLRSFHGSGDFPCRLKDIRGTSYPDSGEAAGSSLGGAVSLSKACSL